MRKWCLDWAAHAGRAAVSMAGVLLVFSVACSFAQAGGGGPPAPDDPVVPEIGAGAFSSALVLLFGGALLLRDRLRR